MIISYTKLNKFQFKWKILKLKSLETLTFCDLWVRWEKEENKHCYAWLFLQTFNVCSLPIPTYLFKTENRSTGRCYFNHVSYPRLYPLEGHVSEDNFEIYLHRFYCWHTLNSFLNFKVCSYYYIDETLGMLFSTYSHVSVRVNGGKWKILYKVSLHGQKRQYTTT